MKKIIDGRKYDTETAEKVLTHDNGYYQTDFYWCEETLYRKKTGEFFIYGEGGAASKYSKICGNGSCGGCAIVPLTEGEAMEFVENCGDVDLYEELFGEVEE